MVNTSVALEGIILMVGDVVAAALKGVHMDGRLVTTQSPPMSHVTPQQIKPCRSFYPTTTTFTKFSRTGVGEGV